jgi:NADPH:quinone reductase-like Zn-dependent oxidoreductase
MGGLKSGETVLIHSAGGGVGIAATQIAKHIGAKVIGTASAAKHSELRPLGADHLIDYRTEDFEVRARQITADAASISFLTLSAAILSRRATGCSRPPAGSECSACHRRPQIRQEACLA